MPSPRRPALAGLLATLLCVCGALLLQAGPARAEAPTHLAPVVHLSVGTGACPQARTETGRAANPCWLVVGAAAGLRVGPVELGAVYEGREPADALAFFLFRPPSASLLGGTLGLVLEPDPRWRLALAGEAGWRRTMNFAKTGLARWGGAADTAYAGATGRLAFGLRPEGPGGAPRLELTVAWRRDLHAAQDVVEGTPWRASGTSVTVGVGLVMEW